MSAFEESAKIGLLATVDPQGLPHVSLITSIQAKSPDALMFGQFSEGLSKQHVEDQSPGGLSRHEPGEGAVAGQGALDR